MLTTRFSKGTIPRRRAALRGVTLMELILALSLAVIVLGAVSMAIDLNLRSFDTRRTVVEESQLARAVLKMIADDLRGVVPNRPIDTTKAMELASKSSSSLASAAGAMTGATTGAPGSTQNANSGAGNAGGASGSNRSSGTNTAASSSTGSTTDSSASNTTDIAESTEPPNVPGLYGNQNEIQVDVSRLPRIDEYGVHSSEDSNPALSDIPSDVKTVAYFMQADQQQATANTATIVNGQLTGPNGSTAGLYRRELDRAVSRYASQNGSSQQLQSSGKLIAPEVAGIEFKYWDGTTWTQEWDSDAYGGLPMAVEVIVAIQPRQVNSNAAVAQPLLYRMVVRLPAAEPIDTTATSEESTNSSSPSSSTGSTSQGVP